jgi:bacillithiol synthase
MHTDFIPYQQIPQLSKTDVAYATGDVALKPFYKYSVDIQSFAKVIADKKKTPTDRELLVNTLLRQYSAFDTSESTAKNIHRLLNENTFTVTTAHQPSLLTGPLYFIYKICSTIRLAEDLKVAYKSNHFVPVFVIGGEDHDFEEVNSISLFNKKITWESNEKGAVGNMHTESLRPVLAELKTILGETPHARRIYKTIEEAYTGHHRYIDATQHLINDLFKEYGLVVLNMNDQALKQHFVPIMKEELVNQPSQNLVAETQKKLNALGFKSQAYPREINLFYLEEGSRERIVYESGYYKVLNSDHHYCSDELLDELEDRPERFSPNVVLRPLYQELILPNLAYIGGGGEIAYWLERKTQFKHFGVNFPMLIRRNSVLWLDKGSNDKLGKLGLPPSAVFQDIDATIKQYVTKNAGVELSLSVEKEKLKSVFAAIQAFALNIDPTLEKTVAAEGVKQLGVVEQLESRLVRAEKQKHETAINQIRSLAQRFCPNGGLQERSDNFLSYYVKYGDTFIETLTQSLNPLKEGFMVLTGE